MPWRSCCSRTNLLGTSQDACERPPSGNPQGAARPGRFVSLQDAWTDSLEAMFGQISPRHLQRSGNLRRNPRKRVIRANRHLPGQRCSACSARSPPPSPGAALCGRPPEVARERGLHRRGLRRLRPHRPHPRGRVRGVVMRICASLDTEPMCVCVLCWVGPTLLIGDRRWACVARSQRNVDDNPRLPNTPSGTRRLVVRGAPGRARLRPSHVVPAAPPGVVGARGIGPGRQSRAGGVRARARPSAEPTG